MWRSDSPSPSFFTKADYAVRSLSRTGRALFLFFTTLLIASVVGLLYTLNASFLIPVPSHGGSWTEGLIGAPRFINPILAVSDADEDFTALVYSGLLKATPAGEYIPDLAESYRISEDGKTYTFVVRTDATFQDGMPVTADDIVFTIAKTQDPALKSSQSANWRGVAVQKVDERTVTFTLGQAYAPFIENITLGILPKHLWQGVSDDDFSGSPLNTSPIGSGPFKVSDVSRNGSGVPTSYVLIPFVNYTLGAPYLDRLTFNFYQSENDLIDALRKGTVKAASGISPARLSELPDATVARAPLNRVFGVFFNQNQSEVLRSAVVRKALSDAIDRKALIQSVLQGYGEPLFGPLPPSVVPQYTSTSEKDPFEVAKIELANDGWVLGADGILEKTVGTGKKTQTTKLSFTVSTGNVPELRAAAEYVRGTWERLGVHVEVAVYDQGDLTQNVIRPRKYDALLFGEVIGREPDLYAFWDSSQRLDPGLNISQYANSSVDSLVEELRSTQDPNLRDMLYKQFSKDVIADTPAVFLYAPDFVYIVHNGIAGINLGFIETPSDRFLSAPNWHQETDYVWPFVARFFSSTQ